MKQKIEELQQQHLSNYHKAIHDTVLDNTDKLIVEDIIPLFKDPPLQSMDALKSKILEKAREEKIILSTEELTRVIRNFRLSMIEEVNELGERRKEKLLPSLEEILQEERFKEEEILDFFIKIRNDLESIFATKIEFHLQEEVVPKLQTFFNATTNKNDESINRFLSSISEYLTYRYPEQITKSVVSKIILKDQTLTNRLKEHNDRYCFTMEHSHLLKKEKDVTTIKKEKRS